MRAALSVKGQAPALVARAVPFIVLWLALAGADPSSLPAGVIAAAVATGISLRLLPPGMWDPSLSGLARLAWRFPRQSIVAGVDVARRALDPQLPLRPGLIAFATQIPPGTARDAFCMMTSLLPGTLPLGTDENGAIVFHCLDTRQPIAANLALEEALFLEAVGGVRARG